jgi:FolB domain-containing protein
VGAVAVTDEAIEKIKAMITSGALRAGDRLPREADLAADLGLSRSSLREAVRALSLVNILDVRRGDGTYVTSLEPRLLLEALSFIVDFHRDPAPGHLRPAYREPPQRAVVGLGTVSRMDTVSVRDLSVRTVIGVHEWERAIEQTLVFSVDMVPATADVRTAAASDDLADALDYSAVAATIAAVVREGKFRLIETAAERVAERLLTDHNLAWLRLEVRKPIPAPTPYTAAITIERTSEIRPLSRRLYGPHRL